jgi:collagenase-like PrtC family protease
MKRKIKYCIGLNGRPGNVEKLMDKYGDLIYEVYAAAPPVICSSGRRGHIAIDEYEMQRQINVVHASGVRYNVVMNGACLGGVEFSETFRAKIKRFIGFLDEAKADSVTVTSPFLIDLIRSFSKRLEIIVSSFAEVIEPYKIKRFEKRGVNRIVLHQNVYRNFEMLKTLKSLTRLPLEIIPNQGCLYQCECFFSHVNIVAHSSIMPDDKIHELGNFNAPIEYCRALRQSDPIEFLMSNIIRPEDIEIYKEMGFEFFKFAGRRSSTEWMTNVLDAYLDRSYDGNIFDLASHIGESKKICFLPNKELDGWYHFLGSNKDCNEFQSKARLFCEEKDIGRFFPVNNRNNIL